MLISQLLQLTSLTFIILPHGRFSPGEQGILPDLRWATAIFQRAQRAPLTIRVELRLNTLARLGSSVCWDGIPLESVVTTCAWSPDGALVASGSFEGTACVWDALTFQQHALIDDARSQPGHLKLSLDARYLAWTSVSPTGGYVCNIWSHLEGDQPKKLLARPNCDVLMHALSFDPKSTRIATAHGGWDRKREEYFRRTDLGHRNSVRDSCPGGTHRESGQRLILPGWQVRAANSSCQGWSCEDVRRDVLERNGFV